MTKVVLTADHEALIDAETKRLEKYFVESDARCRPKMEVRDFVAFTLRRHIALVRNWGNWSKSMDAPPSVRPSEEIVEVVEALVDKWRRGVKQKTRELPPLPFLGYEDIDEERYNVDEATETQNLTALYCQTFGCHFPLPIRLSPLLAARTYSGEDGELLYASSCSVKIRKGQAVSKAVLADVRKRFKAHEQYVSFWEALFEALGVTWASGKPAKFVLSCAPSDFVKLGTLGEDSCYREGGEYEQAKLHIAQIPNSVCLLVYRGDTVIGRAWGILAPKAGGGEFTNFYLTPKQQLLPGLSLALKKALELSGEPKAVSRNTLWPALAEISSSDIFLNDDGFIMAPEGKAEAVHDEVKKAVDRYHREQRKILGDSTDQDDEYDS
jgi:hypothetical protein